MATVQEMVLVPEMETATLLVTVTVMEIALGKLHEYPTLEHILTSTSNGNSASADGNSILSDLGNINVGLPSINVDPTIDVPIT
jgi:hypothetical protein